MHPTFKFIGNILIIAFGPKLLPPLLFKNNLGVFDILENRHKIFKWQGDNQLNLYGSPYTEAFLKSSEGL